MARLDGSGIPVQLGPGVLLRAPGLLGEASLQATLLGGRADEPPRASPALQSALEQGGFEQLQAVEISAQEVSPGPLDVRAPDGSGALSLQVPDLGRKARQVLLLVDEQGVATWHFPHAPSDGTESALEFTVPRSVATAAPAEVGPDDQRGLVGVLGKKLLSVLAFRALEWAAGEVAAAVAARLEAAKRPYLLRTVDQADRRRPGTGGLDGPGWDRFNGSPALLFLHGTFSSTHSGFGGLPDQDFDRLWHSYGGRVLGFDHPTVSVSPQDNAKALLSRIPAGTGLPLDIVAHSRGGLLARAFADALATAGATSSSVRVRQIVFVATPNAGTPLADVKYLAALVDRMTTMLNLIPDGPWSAVTDVLSSILDVVKVIGTGAVGGLPGLQAMDPANRWLAGLGDRADPAIRHFAMDADFEPTGSLLRLTRLPDGAVDLVFGGDGNDMVVPTTGAGTAPGRPGFPVPSRQRVAFGRTHRVWHCSFFSQQPAIDALHEWCNGQGD